MTGLAPAGSCSLSVQVFAVSDGGGMYTQYADVIGSDVEIVGAYAVQGE